MNTVRRRGVHYKQMVHDRAVSFELRFVPSGTVMSSFLCVTTEEQLNCDRLLSYGIN
jgi:hypothetical protein